MAHTSHECEHATQEVIKLGVADAKRIAVGGHSYGAFMTANLLAHAGVLPISLESLLMSSGCGPGCSASNSDWRGLGVKGGLHAGSVRMWHSQEWRVQSYADPIWIPS